MTQRSILIQNYHPQATEALIRDFHRIGFRVVSPDSDWGRIGYFAPNDGLGSEILSFSQYMSNEPGFVLIGCKAQELDLTGISKEHGDKLVLNIAQQRHVYEPDISSVMICPDIELWNNYPGSIAHRLLYFPRPIIADTPMKDIANSFYRREIASYINVPSFWKRGMAAFEEFTGLWSGPCSLFGHEAPNGMLSPTQCNQQMVSSYFTVHFKDDEAYGLSCLESMMLGTPVVSTHDFMRNKTLGECFLKPENSIVTDTIGQAVAMLESLTLDEYTAMSRSARATVLEMTSDKRTIEPLRRAMEEVIRN